MTAMESAISQMEKLILDSQLPTAKTKRTGEYRIGLRRAIDVCSELLQVEKDMVIEAYNARFDSSVNSGEIYYNKTYNNAK